MSLHDTASPGLVFLDEGHATCEQAGPRLSRSSLRVPYPWWELLWATYSEWLAVLLLCSGTSAISTAMMLNCLIMFTHLHY